MSPHLADVTSGGDDPPILLLPNEITAKIFVHCLLELPSVDSGLLVGRPSSREAPLLLGQICGQWRDICIGTSEVWSSLAFTRGSIKLLALWLSRARDCPLALFLHTQDEARADMLMKAVLPHRSQWQDVTFILPLRAIRQLTMYSLPCLERLALQANDLQFDPPIIIRDTPLLRYVDIRYLPHEIDLPFEQLTTLRFSVSCRTAQAVDTLRRCPNLLNLYWSAGFTQPVRPPPPVELPLLRSLKIGDDCLLDLLTVPRLVRLELGSFDAEPEALRSLMLRSSCDLQVLSLTATYQTPTARLRDLFRTVSTVVHLKLDYASIEIQSRALAGRDILPRLRHLEICEDVGTGDDYCALTDTLSRRHQEGTLKRFELSLWGHVGVPSADAMAVFHALAEAGLQVRVTRDGAVLLNSDSA